MNSVVLKNSRNTIATHAKSFFWASQFLPRGCFRDTCVLYSFCRWVDDEADENKPEMAALALSQIEDQLRGKSEPTPLMQEFLSMCEKRGIDLAYAKELILGARSDLVDVRFRDDRELLIYCYRVAGAVGLMMCPLLGVKEKEAKAFAVDLGVAMQLTNICRDVLEDSRKDRVYLPESRLKFYGLSHEDILRGRASGTQVSKVVEELLSLADEYYASAFRGLSYIPMRTRLSILVAAKIYRAIGFRLRLWNFNALRGRAYVPALGKFVLTLKCLVEFWHPRYWRASSPHKSSLHLNLKGLPGIEA